MDFSNEGQSFYHRFQGSFPQENCCMGSRQQWLRDNWTSAKSRSDPITQRLEDAAQRDGMADEANNVRRPDPRERFEEFFVKLILDQADLCHNPDFRATQQSSDQVTTEQIADVFDSYLRYQEGKDDRWALEGRTCFTEHVRHFTAQNSPIEFCLPAFPCKSSNQDKVTGPDPDKGEELALERLHGFVEAIEQVYQAGAKIWIISDGHVFSDCIGVDDAIVDAYGEKLWAMNHAIGSRRGNADRVGFKSLVDLFQLAAIDPEEHILDLAHRLGVPSIDHHVTTNLTDEAELCRRILMAGCGPHKSSIRKRIESKDRTITALYRGFSRFMLEDLENHRQTQGMTRSQQKKLSAKVALEMILRNQAYSNLVEMLFPNHVRLSIHAHNNAGPKFGIQLFDPAKIRAVEVLSAEGELTASLDMLHIPTPWHNSVIQLDGSDFTFVTKAKLARAAVAAGSMTGGLVTTGEGRAYFSLRKKHAISSTVLLAASSTPEVANIENEKDARVGAAEATVTAGKKVVATRARLRKQTSPLENADAVVTAVERRNMDGLSAAEPSSFTRNPWLDRLRWILSLFRSRGW